MNKYSNTVAENMNKILKSASHREIFGGYSDEDKTHEHNEDCSVDDKEMNMLDSDDSVDQFDVDDTDMSDEDMTAQAHFDIAVDSLLSASASLDELGFDKGSAISLKIASLVVEAKKKDMAFKEKMKDLKDAKDKKDSKDKKDKKDSKDKKESKEDKSSKTSKKMTKKDEKDSKESKDDKSKSKK